MWIRRMAALLTLLLSLCILSSCSGAELEQRDRKIEELQVSLEAAQREHDELDAKLRTSETALAASQKEVEALEQQVASLKEEIHALRFPPLEECGTIRVFGVEETILTDGKTEYIHLGRLTEYYGSEVSVESQSLREWEGTLYLPLEQASQLPDVAAGETRQGIRYLAIRKEIGAIPADVQVPVLMYHAVSDDIWGIRELFVSPEEMEKQLAWLVENGYDPIWFEDLNHLEDYDKPVILTFDDGYVDNYTELLPLLQTYNAKATIFVVSNSMGCGHSMTAQQVYEISRSGVVSIQSHGYSHEGMDTMGEEQLELEMGESRHMLAATTGIVPNVVCYPAGRYSSLTVDVAERYYEFGLKMNGGLYITGDNPLLVNRFYISRDTQLQEFMAFCSLAG